MARLQDFIIAAKHGKWDWVDAHIPSDLTPEMLTWATTTGIYDTVSDGAIRDLAATMLENSDAQIEGAALEHVKRLIGTDTNHFVRFRLAFALLKRGDRSDLVLDTVRLAVQDPDVGDIAEKLLAGA